MSLKKKKKHELVQSGSRVSLASSNVDMKCLVAHYRFVEESGQNIINKNPVFDGDLEFLILTLV